jgi:hypothetical protein
MKARIRKTGEVVEIISYIGSTTRNECIDRVSYIDSKGVEHERKPLNYYWDFEQIMDNKEDTHSTIDWNQVRAQVSIGAMQVIISKTDYYTYKEVAMQAVEYADALINELKK